MEYIFLPEAARTTGVPVLLLRRLCEEQRVDGAVRFGNIWAVPDNSSVSLLKAAKLLCRQ